MEDKMSGMKSERPKAGETSAIHAAGGLPPHQQIFCNRTLNLRSIGAVGFDMDYTLVHYFVDAWEGLAYKYLQEKLLAEGWDVGSFQYDKEAASLGVILDTETGNAIKANQFGYIKKASHGMTMLGFEEMRQTYARTWVDLAEPRWVFMNTLFALSEACMFLQLVDKLDKGELPPHLRYVDLYNAVRKHLNATHMEGILKAEVVKHPDKYVDRDPDLPLALMDLKHAGKKVLLITNSEWSYTEPMMKFIVEPFLPKGTPWQSLFDLMIVEARKPDFFTAKTNAYEVMAEGLLKPVSGFTQGAVFYGGHAQMVEKHLGMSGDEILYVGDHVWADVRVSKSMLRWRTCLVVRDLEDELRALQQFKLHGQQLEALMVEKTALEHVYSTMRIDAQRAEKGYGKVAVPPEAIKKDMKQIREKLVRLDAEIAPLAIESAELQSKRWGPVMRAGNDKSHLARQIERSADIYTSRVSNFMHNTPFVYLRSKRGAMPHEVT